MKKGKGGIRWCTKLFFRGKNLLVFYEIEMGRLGWAKSASFAQGELLFLFKKEKQSCIISIRPSKPSWLGKKATQLYVYLQI